MALTDPAQHLVDLLFQQSRSGLCLVGTGGKVSRVNGEWLRLAGVTAEQVIGQDISLWMTDVMRRGGEAGREVTVSPVTLGGGTGLLVSVHHSDRRPATKDASALRAGGDGPYHQIFEAMNEAFATHEIILDGDGVPCDYRFLEVNPAFEAMTGLEKANVVGRCVTDVLPGLDPHWINTYGKVALTGEPVRFERYEKALDRRYEVFAFRTAPLEFSVLFVDVTERTRAADALRLREGRFRALIEHATDMILVVDANANLQFVSPSVEEQLGWSSGEVTGTSVLAYVHPDDQARLVEVLGTVMTTPDSVGAMSGHFLHKDGTWHLVEATGRNLLNSPAVEGIVVNARDMTKQRELEEQFHHAQKLESVGRLAGGIAHDFNNLLTVVLSGAEELERDVEQGRPPDRELVEDIAAAGERGRALTRHLLAFARKQVIAPRLLDLNQVVAGSEHMLRRVIGEDIDLHVVLQPGLWTTFCDPGEVEQVLLNLVVNARDAMPGGGRLTIQTENTVVGPEDVVLDPERRLGEWVRLVVRDSGLGISPEAKAHLFEPFFTTKPEGKGTGLGLATAYGIVKQSGGHIHASSDPGSGATFEICLPRRTEPLAAPRAAVPEPKVVGGTENVLVVEDDPVVRDLASRALRAAGYQVIVASDGQEVRGLGDDQVALLHLLVTDVLLPGINGRELADELRLRHPSLPVLYMSGYTQDAFSPDTTLDGAMFLAKPFTSSELLARVREVLDAARPR